MNITGVRFNQEDGSILIEWYDDAEQKVEGGTLHQSYITLEGQENWQHVGYYAKELYEDVEELLSWFGEYQKGTVDGQN